jgi:tetratricopeptide (TPR) repeat protein
VQARRLEAELQKDPDNLPIRGALIVFYANERNDRQFLKHTWWVVEHNPEDPILALTNNFFLERGNYERIKAAWEEAVGTRSDSAETLYHAGLFFESEDPRRALDLFTRAKAMTTTDPSAQERYLGAIAFLYAVAVTSDVKNGDPNWRFNNIAISANTAAALRADVETSTDPRFLSKVGTSLVELGDDQLARVGLAYIGNAIQLDPGDPRWKDALDSAKAEPIRRRNYRMLTKLWNTTGADATNQR